MEENVTRRLRLGAVRFLMIDIQERLLPSIHANDAVVANSRRLLAAARLLDVPVFYTEQYPKGIGVTVGELMKALPETAKRFEKTHFSCVDEPGFKDFLYDQDVQTVTVVWGTEAHICVLSTVMDMLDCGKRVAVVSDASCSRTRENRDMAMDAMRAAGALVLPTETVVYQLLGRSGTDAFKAMLPFFK